MGSVFRNGARRLDSLQVPIWMPRNGKPMVRCRTERCGGYHQPVRIPVSGHPVPMHCPRSRSYASPYASSLRHALSPLQPPGFRELLSISKTVHILPGSPRASNHDLKVCAMDPLSALGVAGNVVQFTQFACQLVSGTVEKYKSGSSDRVDAQVIEEMYNRLSHYSRAIQAWLQPPRPTEDSAVASRYATDLRDITAACKKDCDELIELMGRFRVPPGSRAPLWRAFQKTMLEMWKSALVAHLRDRVRESQSAVTVLLCAISRLVTHGTSSTSVMDGS